MMTRFSLFHHYRDTTGDPRAIRYLLDLAIRQGGVEEWPSEASASFASTLRAMAAGE